MSIRDGLIAVGIIILLVVLADLLRRFLRRNKLRLAIDEKFKNLPDIDLSSELPNGGARLAAAKAEPSTLQPSPASKPASVSDQSINNFSAKTAPESSQETETLGHSSPDSWVIDPILSGNRGPDDEVDLLLDLEFKGVGKGASGWLKAEQKVMAEEPEGDAEAHRPNESAQPETLAVEDHKSGRDSELDSEETVAVPAPIGLVTELDSIDLERPVHELLQARKQADSEAAELNNLQTASAAEVASSAAEESKAVDAKLVDAEIVEAQVYEKLVTEIKATEKRAASPAPQAKSPTPVVRRPELQPSLFDSDPDLAPAVKEPAAKPKSRRRRKKTEQQAAISSQEQEAEVQVEDEVLIINVLAKQAPFSGPLLFKLVEACGLEFGEMDIFHRFEEAKGQGALQFSMANAVRPGTFDPTNQQPAATPAVTFFLRLEDPTNRMNALECMLATAQCVADNLGGELKDENRSSLRTQTIEHYRQKVREFERKKLTRRN